MYINAYSKIGAGERGYTAEQLYRRLAIDHGFMVTDSTSDQDRIEHWDWMLIKKGRFKVEVKAMKKANGSPPQDKFTWIELQGITGYPGWIYGKADVVAFQERKWFRNVKRVALVRIVEEYMKIANPLIYTRRGRQDKAILMPTATLDFIPCIFWEYDYYAE